MEHYNENLERTVLVTTTNKNKEENDFKSIKFYDINPYETGPGNVTVTYRNVSVGEQAGNVGEWLKDIDGTYYYYRDINGWVNMGDRNYETLTPYIIGSNEEYNLRIRIPGYDRPSGDDESPSWIRLPSYGNSEEEDAIASMYKRDDRVFIDTSFCTNVYLLATNWIDSTVTDNLDGYGHSGFSLEKRSHIIVEYYPRVNNDGSTSAKWKPVDGLGLLFMENSWNADGWGNEAERDSTGRLKRYTVNEAQVNYITEQMNGGVSYFDTVDSSVMFTKSGIVTGKAKWYDITDPSNWDLVTPVLITNQNFSVAPSQWDAGEPCYRRTQYSYFGNYYVFSPSAQLLGLASLWKGLRISFNTSVAIPSYYFCTISGSTNNGNVLDSLVTMGVGAITPGLIVMQPNVVPEQVYNIFIIKIEVLY